MKISPTKTIGELVSILAHIIDIEKNKYNYHSWRVAILSTEITRDLVSHRRLQEIFYAGLLFDVGGVGLSHHIIHYLKRQNKDNRYLLLSHPIIGAELISNIPQMTQIAKLILDHHEWINGQGYPRGKKEEHIPKGAQIIRIADSIDTAIQINPLIKLKELKSMLSLNINKEYSKRIFFRTLDILKQNRLFYHITKRENIPELFQETEKRIGFIHIPLKIDAIGTCLEVISQIIDMKHPYSSGHSLRVARYAMVIALAMGLEHDKITQIKWAGLLHDIGKLNLPRKILDKPSDLTTKEFRVVKQHAVLTHEIIEMMPSLREIASIASGHHERFDDKGYPLGLSGKDIPLGAKILAVCDAFDAMISNRPYRQPFTVDSACQEIERHAGTQFDPEIVRYALPLLRNLSL